MKKLVLLLAFSAFGLLSLMAQTRVITGTVTSADDGTTLPGVSVTVKGTTMGTITNIDGVYNLNVPENAQTLVFSFVGMKTTEQDIKGQSVINVALSPDVLGIDEVVVVGYGTATKQSFVGSVSEVKAQNIQDKAVSNISESLAGEAAGVQVITTSGQPGSSATIRIRGYGSVNGNRDPLYVLDGVPYSGSLNAINPNDIASTTILKDASATAIYGSRGANGVILLTTKSGQAGKSVIEVDVKRGINVSGIPRYKTIKSPEKYIELSWEALYNKGVARGEANPVDYANNSLFSGAGIDPKYNLWSVDGADLINPETGMINSGVTRKYNPENWEDYGFQNSNRTEGNITFRGGNEKTKFFTSFGFLNDVGYIINSDFTRYNATINLQSNIRKWLSTTARMTYSGTETNNNGQSDDSGSIFWFVDNLPPIYPLFLRDSEGNKIPDPIYGGYQYDYGVGRGFGALTNSIADAHYDRSRAKNNQLSANFSANIHFVRGLTLENTLGGQYYMNKYFDMRNPFYGSAAGESQKGYVYHYNTELKSYNLLNLLRFKRTFGIHNLEALVAHESNSWERQRLEASKSRVILPNIADMNNYVVNSAPPGSWTDRVRLESYFGQVNYNYNSKYYLSASVRRDGTSRFVGDNKWDNFGSIGFSWVLSNEPFLDYLPIFSFLKYKASYGIMGEQQGVGFYPSYITFDTSNLNNQISISELHIGNPDLTWEKSKMFQTGLEFGLGNFLEGSVDYFMKNTDNLLFDRRVGPSVGYALLTVNDGQLRNSGVEFDLTAHFIKTRDFELNLTANGSFLSNKLIRMPIEPRTGLPKVIDVSEAYVGRAKGHSLYDFYLREWAGVDPADGVGMWYEYYEDKNSNGMLDPDEAISSLFPYMHDNPDAVISKTTTKFYPDATQKYVGKSAIPKIRGAFRLEARIKDFDIAAQFLYSLGGYAYDFVYAQLMDNDAVGANNWSTDILQRWQKPGDITNVPRLSSGYDTNVRSASTRFITSSDFLSLNNVRVGYTVPTSFSNRYGISSLSIFATGDNLFLLSARDGFNPSTDEAGTSDWYTYSPLTTYTVGLRVKF